MHTTRKLYGVRLVGYTSGPGDCRGLIIIGGRYQVVQAQQTPYADLGQTRHVLSYPQLGIY